MQDVQIVDDLSQVSHEEVQALQLDSLLSPQVPLGHVLIQVFLVTW